MLKKGDKVKVVYEALNVEVDCIVEDVGYDSINLKRETSDDTGNIKTLFIDGNTIDFLTGNCYEGKPDDIDVSTLDGRSTLRIYPGHIIEITTNSKIDSFYEGILSKKRFVASVIKQDGIITSGEFYCVAAEKLNDNLYAYELLEKR